MNSTVLSFGRKVVSHETFEDFIFSIPLVVGWATIWALFFGFDSFIPNLLCTSLSVVGIRFFIRFMDQWFRFAKDFQTELTNGFDRLIQEEKRIEILIKEQEKEKEQLEIEVKNTNKTPPKAKETVVIQTKKMTLRTGNANRPGRKPKNIMSNNKKET